MNTLIVDDNEMARMIMHEVASQVEDLTVVGHCASAIEAYNLLQKQPVDLLLLDIEMPGMSGIELAKHFNNGGPIIIFTTANKEYAAEAFDLDVADYIVKPITHARFLQALKKVKELQTGNTQPLAGAEDSNHVFIRDNGVMRRIALDDILYAEAMGDYSKVFTEKKFYTLHATLKAIGEKLPASRFLRIHRSYIIAVDKIDSIDAGAVQIGKKSIMVADAYKAALQKKLNFL